MTVYEAAMLIAVVFRNKGDLYAGTLVKHTGFYVFFIYVYMCVCNNSELFCIAVKLVPTINIYHRHDCYVK